MALTEFGTDEGILDNLRMFFEVDEQEMVDWDTVLGQLVDVGAYFEVKVMGRCFHVAKRFGDVVEVES